MFFEVTDLAYHSPITNDPFTYEIAFGIAPRLSSKPVESRWATERLTAHAVKVHGVSS
jgi:hypothetical protein